MPTVLTFTKNEANRYEAKFVSSGERTVVKLQTNKEDKEVSGSVLVYANLQDMEPLVLANFAPSHSGNYIFEVDVPEGTEIKIESMSEVILSKITE